MSYTTGTADSRDNLLDLFKIFASTTSDWVVDRHAVKNTGWILNMHKTGYYGDILYAHLRTVNAESLPGRGPITGLAMSMSDSYDAAKDATNQPGCPASTTDANAYYSTSVFPVTVGIKYWFFSQVAPLPEFLGMVLLLPNGEYKHIAFGDVKKTDETLLKGAFMFGTDGHYGSKVHDGDGMNRLPFETTANTVAFMPGSSYLRLIGDEKDGWFSHCHKNDFGLSTPTEGRAIGPMFRDGLLLYNSRNQFSNSAALCPINLYFLTQVNKWAPVGHIPAMRIARRQAFIVDHVYTLGPDQWMGFPSWSGAADYAIVYNRID